MGLRIVEIVMNSFHRRKSQCVVACFAWEIEIFKIFRWVREIKFWRCRRSPAITLFQYMFLIKW